MRRTQLVRNKTGRSRPEGLGLGLDILQDLNTKGFYTKIGGGEVERDVKVTGLVD